MNVTKEVITDLYPLYVEKECSADTRTLVEEYLRLNPQHAEELRRIMTAPIHGTPPPAKDLSEAQSLRDARRCLRYRSALFGLAIFFSLSPFSLIYTSGKTYWFFSGSPEAALIYGAIAVVCWIAYAVIRSRSNSL